MSIADKLTTIAENVQKVYEAGKAQGGGGVEYSSIVYNDDGTVTLTESNGTVHTMTCTYEDGKLIGATYDGNVIELTYDGDVLIGVADTQVDMSNAPATSGGVADGTISRPFVEKLETELSIADYSAELV